VTISLEKIKWWALFKSTILLRDQVASKLF